MDPGSHTVRTGEQLRLSATITASGEPAPVKWRIVGSDNAPVLGAGSISADGVYMPPAMLSRDLATVTITAGVAENSTGAPLTTTVSVMPGFIQPLQPENATLAPGSSIQVRAQLAEVSHGSVTWSFENAAGSSDDTAALGALSAQHCESGPRQFTTCTVTYTAPAAPKSAAAGQPVWLVASTHASVNLPGVSVRARLVTGTVTSNPALHQVEQSGPVMLGSSGGSDNDFDTYKDRRGTRYVADCCGGTLGGLVEDQWGTPYILSNNHVLAVSDQGQVGDTIEQPGMIDDGCVPLSQAGSRLQPVGTLRYAVPLKARSSNVDAALASVHPGVVDPSGGILELGQPGDSGLRSAPPVAGRGEVLDAARLDGLSVVKSGRTTGLTCSTVDAVDLRVTVDYYKDCAETQPYTTKTFTGQIGIGGDAFADSGDSGALVLDAANANAVGLLYATGTAGTGNTAWPGTGLTLANPIGDVLSELARETGSPLTLRGTSTPHSVACLKYDPPLIRAAPSTLSPDERARTASAVEAAAMLRSARAPAAAAGVSADEPGRGAVTVYVDRAQPPVAVPATIAGIRTVIVPLDLDSIARGERHAAAIHPGMRLSARALAAARLTVEDLGPRLMRAPAIFGVGVTQSLDSPDEAALLVLIDTDAPKLETARLLQRLVGPAEMPADTGIGTLPALLGGMRVRYMTMHRMRVTQSKYVARGAASSCSLR